MLPKQPDWSKRGDRLTLSMASLGELPLQATLRVRAGLQRQVVVEVERLRRTAWA